MSLKDLYGQPPAYEEVAEPEPGMDVDPPAAAADGSVPMGTPVKIWKSKRRTEREQQQLDEEVKINIRYSERVTYPDSIRCKCNGTTWDSDGGVGLDLCNGTVSGKDLFLPSVRSKVLNLSEFLFPLREDNLWQTKGANVYEKLSNFVSSESELGLERRQTLFEADWVLTARDEVVALQNRKLPAWEKHLRKPEDLPVVNLFLLSFMLEHADAKKSIRVLNWPDYNQAKNQADRDAYNNRHNRGRPSFRNDRYYNDRGRDVRVKFTDITLLRKQIALKVAPELTKSGLIFNSAANKASWLTPRSVVMMCRGGAISQDEREAADQFGSLVIDVRLHKGKYNHLKDHRSEENEKYYHRITDEDFANSAIHMVNQFSEVAQFIKVKFQDEAPYTLGKVVLSMDEHSGQAIFAAATYAGLGIASMATVLQYFDGSFIEYPVLLKD